MNPEGAAKARLLCTPPCTPDRPVTRYPKSGKGRKWTIVELKAIGPTWRGDALNDGDGLLGTVRVGNGDSVSVHFRYGFRWQGRRAWHYCGTWPTSSLEQVRSARDVAQADLKAGVNPTNRRTASRIEEQQKVLLTIQQEAERVASDASLQSLFDQWVRDGVARKDGNAEIRRSFQKDLLPQLGNQPVRTLTEHDLRGVLRSMVARGVNRMAVNFSRDVRQMFAWAEKRQPWRRLLQDGNPANLIEIERIVASDYDLSNVRTRILSPEELRELHSILERSRAAYEAAQNKRATARPVQPETQLALWLCLATCCRIGELLMAKWTHVDLVRATWFIPKQNVKGSKGTQQDQLVFLSPFALKQFAALSKRTGHTDWCFPSRKGDHHVGVKSVSKQIGDRQVRFKNRRNLRNRANDDSLVLSEGETGEWTPHDLRRTAATMMQALGVSPDVIDRCQNHVLSGSRVRRHYLRHDYADEKRAAWHALGAQIERVLAPEFQAAKRATSQSKERRTAVVGPDQRKKMIEVTTQRESIASPRTPEVRTHSGPLA